MSIPTSIKNIIFDLGGVILNIDYTLAKQAFEKLGASEFDKLYSQVVQNRLFDDLETGKITPATFRHELKKAIPHKISDNDIDTAWNALLLDLPLERIRLLEKIKLKYRLFLLSNTNEIHITAFSNYLQKNFGFKNMSHIFEKEYFSYKVGLRKPDKKIFELVLQENTLVKSETLFIDDSLQHIESANYIGINAILLEKGKTILDLFT